MTGTPPSSGEPAQPADPLRDEIAHLHEAVRSQRDVGMAIGLMSVRFGCSGQQAWRMLLQVSHDTGTDIGDVARVLVSTHDGEATPDELQQVESFLHQLPLRGWPSGPWQDPDS